MEENFSMERKIFGMEWKWNGRKLPVWNMEKLSSIPFHTMPWLSLQNFYDNNILTYFKGSHLRSCASAAEWLHAPVLKPKTWV